MRRTHGVSALGPPLEVKHKEGKFIVTVELPGIAKEDIRVEVIEESLVVEGEKKAVKEEEEGYYRSERSYGKFYRSIPLPQGAKADEIKAELTSGILKVIIPVPEVTGPSSPPDRDGKVVIGRRGHSVAL